MPGYKLSKLNLKIRRKRLLRLGLLYVAHNRKKSREYWVHPLLRSRSTEGAWETYVKTCRERFPDKHKEALRMNSESFDMILEMIKDTISKQDTNYRRAIPADQRLCVTLYFLSTGDSFRTVSTLFRLGVSTVRQIVHNTCQA